MALWIKTNIIDVERAKAAAQGGGAGGLKIAGSSGDGKHEDSIGIVLSVDKDEATRRLERDQEAAAKRAQNMLPAWHLKSTISGDLTALGIKGNARAEEASAMAAATLPNSNDTILKGLGQKPPGTPNQDVKPNVSETQESDCEHIWSACYGHLPSTNFQITTSITPLWRRLLHPPPKLRLPFRIWAVTLEMKRKM